MASEMTDLNMRVLYKELLRGGGIITRIEQTSAKHLRRAIDAGYLEELRKNSWQVSTLGRQKLAEWLDTPSGRMAKKAFAEKHPEPAPGMARGQKPSEPFTAIVAGWAKKAFARDVSLEANAVLYMTVSLKSLAALQPKLPRNFWQTPGVTQMSQFFVNEAGVVIRLVVSAFRGKIGGDERECTIYCQDRGVAETFRDWLLEKVPGSYVDEFYTWPNSSPALDESKAIQKAQATGNRTITVNQFATLEGISPLQMMNALGATSGFNLDSSQPVEAWAPRRLVFFRPSAESTVKIDTLWFWPNKAQLFVVSALDDAMKQEELVTASSPTWEERARVISRNSRKPIRWGVFSQATSAPMVESFLRWLEHRLSPAGGAAGMKRRGMKKHLDDDARDFRAIDKDARDIERRVKALVARDKHVEGKKGGRR